MSYDEAKLIALDSVTPRLGEQRIMTTGTIIKVMQIKGNGLLVVKPIWAQGGNPDAWVEWVNEWHERVSTGFYKPSVKPWR